MKRIFSGILTFTYLANGLAFIPMPNHPKQAADCQKQPLYCKIMQLQTKAKPQWAMALSKALNKYAKQYQMDPWLSLAIAMQESRLRHTHRNNRTLVFYETCNDQNQCEKKYKVVKGYSDLGVFQLHINTITHYGIDPIRLNEDMEYMVDWHYKILREKLAQCEHYDKEAWGCYHSRTPVLHERYVHSVAKYYYGDQTILNHDTPQSESPSMLTKAKATLKHWLHQ